MLSFLNDSKTEEDSKPTTPTKPQEKVYMYQVMRNERLFGNKKLTPSQYQLYKERLKKKTGPSTGNSIVEFQTVLTSKSNTRFRHSETF